MFYDDRYLWRTRERRYPAKETAAKHERGFENETLGEVMKAAGLTHGAFYAQFGSKQELQEPAIAYGQGLSAGRGVEVTSTRISFHLLLLPCFCSTHAVPLSPQHSSLLVNLQFS
jgi:hypothetical protein